MLTQRKVTRLERPILLVDKSAPFLHQPPPQLLRLRHPDREALHRAEDLLPHLRRERRQRARPLHRLRPPMPLLRRHIRRRRDLDVWVDEEEREDLAVAGFRRVGEAEGADAVLEDVGEGEEAAFGGEDVADVLDAGALVFAAEDVGEPFEVALLVVEVFGKLGFASLAEGEAAFGDVGAVVVVQGGGADMFVLHGGEWEDP